MLRMLTKIVGALKARGCQSDEFMCMDLTEDGPDPRFLRAILCSCAGLVDLSMVCMSALFIDMC